MTSLISALRRRNKKEKDSSSTSTVSSSSSSSSLLTSAFERTESLSNGLVLHLSGAPLASAATVFAMIHGAGMCAQSFSLLSNAILAADDAGSTAVLAFDMRAHGASTAELSDEFNLSMRQLCSDASFVLQSALPEDRDLRLVLVGHSLGGAIATHLAAQGGEFAFVHARHRVAALVVLDVVEGTAIESLEHMRTLLDNRPSTFPSLEDAVKWSVDSGVPRNSQSARISVPPLFVFDEPAELFRWRTPLRDTAPFWPQWFEGMSARFLSTECPRLLLLAADADSRHGGAERLDGALTAAHMQGRFQLELVRDTGHALHEDRPGVVAGLIGAFLLRRTAGGGASSRMALLEAANAQLRAQKAAAAAVATKDQ